MITQKNKDLQKTELLYIKRWWRPNSKFGKSISTISRDLGRAKSTISTIIKKYKVLKPKSLNTPWVKKYYFDAALAWNCRQKLRKNKGRKCKLKEDNPFFKKIKLEMVDDLSIEVCAKRLEKKGEVIPVCTRTIYNYVYRYGKKLLIEGSYTNKRKRKIKEHKDNFKYKTIDQRPDIAGEFGHWEIDTVVGPLGKLGAVLVLTERITGYNINYYLPKLNSINVFNALMKISKSFDNSLFETITSDNGTEFALLPKFEKILNCSVYFARPYCSVDKAFVERNNRVLRRKIPKGSLMEIYNQKDIEMITKWMNNYERKSKGFKTPAELFNNYCQLSTTCLQKRSYYSCN